MTVSPARGQQSAWLLAFYHRIGVQPQPDVGWLHRLPYHSYQIVAQRAQVCFVAQAGREGF